MHKEQSNRYNMFLVIQKHFDDHPIVWNTNIPVSNAKTLLTNYIVALSKTFEIQLKNNTGIAVDKKIIREGLETQAYVLASGATAYAIFSKQTELLLQTKYRLSELKKLRDTELQSVATNLVTNLQLVIPALAPYGITLATLETLTETINLFAANINKPKEASELKKEATAKMDVIIKDASLLLKTQLDLLIIGLQASEPEFALKYLLLRLLRKPSRTKLGLRTLVVDASTLLAIEGAGLEVLQSKIKRVSSGNGINLIKNIIEGPHELKVSHKDYKELLLPFTIVHGETTKLDIHLEAISKV